MSGRFRSSSTACGEKRDPITADVCNGLSVSGNYTLSECMGHPNQGGSTPNVNSGYTNPADIDYDYESESEPNPTRTRTRTTPSLAARPSRSCTRRSSRFPDPRSWSG